MHKNKLYRQPNRKPGDARQFSRWWHNLLLLMLVVSVSVCSWGYNISKSIPHYHCKILVFNSSGHLVGMFSKI
jgi:hypothetical protein